MTTYLKLDDGAIIPLPARKGMPESVHVIDATSVLAVNAALAAERPLLLRGDPGTGKSQLARAAAEALGRMFVHFAVNGRTEPHDLLWSVDSVARLAEAQVMGAMGQAARDEARARIDILGFVRPGVLWWAFSWESARDQARRARVSAPETLAGWTPERGVVVLVDEIDKADASVPNGLLDAFGHGRFDVPGREEAVELDRRAPPLVVITTNEERSLPDAFLRRCLVHHLALPAEKNALVAALVTRGRAHFPMCATEVLVRAAELLASDREQVRFQGLAPPGLAEYVDLIRAATRQRSTKDEQLALLELISGFAFRKHSPESPA